MCGNHEVMQRRISRTAATSKMKRSILDVAEVLDPPLRCIPQNNLSGQHGQTRVYSLTHLDFASYRTT